jgi:hypothetical protein
MRSGALLRVAAAEFDARLTRDRGIAHEQDLRGLPLRLVMVRAVSTEYDVLLPLVPEIEEALERVGPGELVVVAA